MARSAAASSTAPELHSIDRLEEKVRLLVTMIESLRNERARAVDDAAHLQRELDAARSRLGEASGASQEAATLREERELIRARVAQMITQIDKLNL